MSKQSDLFGKALCFVFLFFISSSLLAQNRVTGKVINQGDNQPIVGATVQQKGTTNATQTITDGTFAINVPGNAILVITVVGYTGQEVPVNGRTNISLSLQSASGSLSEVVVIGYGTQSRRNVTSAISSIDNKTLNEVPASNFAQALQGRMAGVSVVNNGTPGSQPIVRIRGISSITFSSDPLYIICLLYTSPSPRDRQKSRMPSSA